MSWIERLLLGGAVGLGLVLLVVGLRENAEEMQAAPTTVPRIPIGAGTPWDPDQAVRSPQHCTTAEQRSGVTWVSASGETAWVGWSSSPEQHAVPSAVPFDEPWSVLRVHFCRKAPIELTRSEAEPLVIGTRLAASGRRIRAGLYEAGERSLGTPYRIELLTERSPESNGLSEEERPE
ncbi:hypothetical protein HFP89_06980 [Wenzhouxiangella sp. XN79A]|uniref:hypothetical protein n=1 Tax=Wenzhouxiangella sp. XN79A TaxID=2724193 RepID=UPI00144A8831|nr:hypothetical protein [Wenzhouxiangella sp. XN79A]NKI34904.1 hypothetical protein [Wenzhouxiangella sp. XN79A]